MHPRTPRVEDHWLLDVFCGRPVTGCHAWVFAFVALVLLLPLAQVALAWLLHQRHVTSVIIGARTEEQLRDNLAATKVTLSADDLAALDAASALPQEYPGWMIGFQHRDRWLETVNPR